MLSGEGNENGKKKNNNRSNQQKSNFARAAYFFCTFLCRCFARLLRETSRNFLVTRFMERKSDVFLFTLFSLSLIFTLVAANIPPLQNFKLFLQQKMSPFVFSLSLQFSFLVELRWPVALLSLFLSLSLSLYSKFVDMTINLSLILKKPRIQKHFPLSVFVVIDANIPPLQNFKLFLQQKMSPFVFSLSLQFSFLVELRWPVALLSLFLSLSLSLYSKFVDMTINLSLILKKPRIQKHFPLSVFVVIDSLVVSASQDAGGHTLSRQNKLTFGLGSHVLGVRTVVRTLRQ